MRFPHSRLVLSLMLIGAFMCPFLTAQEPDKVEAPVATEEPVVGTPGVVAPEDMPNLEELEAKAKAAEGGADAEKFTSMVDLRKKIDVATAAAAVFDQRIKEIPDEEARVTEQLGNLQERVVLPEGLSLGADVDEEEVSAANERVKSNGEAAADRLKGLRDEADLRQRRLDDIPGLISTARAGLEQAEEQLRVGAPNGDEALALRLTKDYHESQVELLEAEKKFYREAAGLLSQRRELAMRESEAWSKLAVLAQSRVDAARAKMAKEAAEKAEEVASDPKLLGPLAEIAEEGAKWAQMRSGPNGLAKKISVANQDLAALKARLAQIDRDHADATEQVNLIEKAGLRLGEPTGNLLRKEKRNLPRIRETRGEVRKSVKELTAVRLELVRLEALRRDKLSDIDGAVDSVLEELRRAKFPGTEGAVDSVSEESGETSTEKDRELQEQVRELITAKREHLDDLIADNRAYSQVLGDILSQRRQLIDRVKEYTGFIEQRVFWIRSGPPLHASNLEPDSIFLEFVSVDNWGSYGKGLLKDFRRYPGVWLLALIVFGYLFWSRKKHKTKLGEAGDQAVKRNCRTYVPTLKAIFHSVMIAVLLPLFIAFFYWRSLAVAGMDDGSWAAVMSRSLKEIFFPAVALAVARTSCRKRGLLQCHLEMGGKKAQLLYTGFSWAMVFIIPLVFFREALYLLDHRAASRICYIMSMIVVAAFAFLVLRPSVGLAFQWEKIIRYQLRAPGLSDDYRARGGLRLGHLSRLLLHRHRAVLACAFLCLDDLGRRVGGGHPDAFPRGLAPSCRLRAEVGCFPRCPGRAGKSR